MRRAAAKTRRFCARDERARQFAFRSHDADLTTDQIARKARSKFQNQCSCPFERMANGAFHGGDRQSASNNLPTGLGIRFWSTIQR